MATFRLLGYLREAIDLLSWRLARAFGLMLLIGLTEGFGLLLLVPLLQLVGFQTAGGSLEGIASAVAAVFRTAGIPLTLASVLALYVLVLSARALLSRYEAVSSFQLQQSLISELRRRLYLTLTRANWLFFVRARSSDLFHKMTRELEVVGAATFTLLSWLVALVVALIYIAFALYLAPLLTVLVLACGAALSLALQWQAKQAHKRGESLAQAYESMYAGISDQLAGMKTAKGHGVERGYVDMLVGMTTEVERAHVEVLGNNQAVRFWFQVGSTLILAGIAYVALATLSLGAANVVLLIYLFARLIPMLSGLQSGYQKFLSYLPSYQNVKRLEARASEAEEPNDGSETRLDLDRSLEFRKVWFSYGREATQPALQDVSLTLESGQTIAIVGPSGSGKSTIADMAVGLLRPDAGAVLLDGVPLRLEDLAHWRRSVGYVTQDTFLFHATVRENLLLAKPGARKDELATVLEAASAGFVSDLPRGLDSVLGDRGSRLSGGERQRLALARALLRDPELLVLDEATSSLDAENELRIQEAIDNLHGHQTILVIAHRLATVRNADRIYVLERGRVVEAGSWEELTEQRGRFYSLCRAQGLSPLSASSASGHTPLRTVETERTV